jgi:hypothetical protein
MDHWTRYIVGSPQIGHPYNKNLDTLTTEDWTPLQQKIGHPYNGKLDTLTTENLTPLQRKIGHPYNRKFDTLGTENWTPLQQRIGYPYQGCTPPKGPRGVGILGFGGLGENRAHPVKKARLKSKARAFGPSFWTLVRG